MGLAPVFTYASLASLPTASAPRKACATVAQSWLWMPETLLYWPPCMPSFRPPKTIAACPSRVWEASATSVIIGITVLSSRLPPRRVLRIDLQAQLVDDLRRALEVPAVDVDHGVPDVGARCGARAVEKRRVGDLVRQRVMHPDGVGVVRIDALEGDVVRPGRPLEGGDADQVAGERGPQDGGVRLAHRRVRRLVGRVGLEQAVVVAQRLARPCR